MNPDARRLEELSLNSSAPPGQLLYDGWLLRMLPGKAKRARSVNAVYPSTLPVADKIEYCERLYARLGLPALFRITPFVQPSTLDRELESRGYGTFDATAVESAPIPLDLPGDCANAIELDAFVDAIGDLRGSPPEHRSAHRARLQGTPLALHAVAVEQGGSIVAAGLTIVEDDCAGLFDIATHDGSRRQGHARKVVTGLLAKARALGARHAYLQVQSDNTAARALYRDFGFVERYTYWYRGREGERK